MKKEVPALLSNNIKEYRLKKQLTQQQLADLVNVSSRTIISLEKGQYNQLNFVLVYHICFHKIQPIQ